MSNYAIFRVAKLKPGYGKSSIGRAMRHLNKHEECADISRPERLHLDRQKKFCSDYRAEVRQAIKKHNENSRRALRSDASIGCEMVFTYSKEMEEQISPKEFYECIKKFYNENFKGCTLLQIDYHASETCNHYHLICLTTTEDGRISSRAYLGDKAHLSALQDRFADICKSLGLERGKRYTGQKNKPSHIALRTHKAKQLADIDRLEKIKKNLQSDICQELSR